MLSDNEIMELAEAHLMPSQIRALSHRLGPVGGGPIVGPSPYFREFVNAVLLAERVKCAAMVNPCKALWEGGPY